MDLTQRKRILWILLAILGLCRLAWFMVDFGRNSLQMDLASYWIAGASVDLGLSPYENQLLQRPELWDGIAAFKHSRFFYPPLVARLFQPFAYVPYAAFKYLWMVASLAATFAALYLAAGRRMEGPRLWINLFAISTFFPLLTLLERGQVDAMTLLLITVALLAQRRGRSLAIAGTALALAIALKLHVLFVVPFLVWGRRWRLLGATAIAGVVMLLLSVGVDGEATWKRYLGEELPRVSRYGEGGPRDSWLNPLSLEQARHGLEQGKTLLDGKQYEQERLQFVLNGSLVRTPVGSAIWKQLRTEDWRPTRGQVALLLLALIFTLNLLALRGRPPADPLVMLQLALTTASLTAPLTWTMNLVWLLPLVPLLLARDDRRRGAPFVLLLGGFCFAALPPSLPGAISMWEGRFVVAQIAIWIGLLLMARREATAGSR